MEATNNNKTSGADNMTINNARTRDDRGYGTEVFLKVYGIGNITNFKLVEVVNSNVIVVKGYTKRARNKTLENVNGVWF